ncbi:MAG: recombination mediator RecR [bacterium]
MSRYTQSMEKLINAFSRFPGVGPKTAERMAFYVLKTSRVETDILANAIVEVKDKIQYCLTCNNITESNPCSICRDDRRDPSIICVVETPQDIVSFEKIRDYRGVYHVLLGALSPLEGIGPGDLKIKELLLRLQKGSSSGKKASASIKEIIIATNPDVEGEATAAYLAQLIKPLGVKVTRLAQGLPLGADIEYADEVTLLRALEGRREL